MTSGQIYYNEIDRYPAQWLRNLISAGQLPEGVVDERDIRLVEPSDAGATSHWFAGIGGWPYALQLAGWDAARPVWTASCPCQPFSQAGKRRGTADERHLWPVLRSIIAECRPATIFGEQVASKDGRIWLAGVRADLEALGYAVGVADLCAASVGAPHIRQRLFWVADTGEQRFNGRQGVERSGRHSAQRSQESDNARDDCEHGGLAHADGRQSMDGELQPGRERRQQPQDGQPVGGLGNATSERDGPQPLSGSDSQGEAERRERCAGGSGAWDRFDLIPCRDGKTRRIESGSFPLAHGIPNRVGRLRGYGNAIVAPLAAEFIRAYLSIE